MHGLASYRPPSGPKSARSGLSDAMRDRLALFVVAISIGFGGLAWVPVAAGFELDNLAPLTIFLLAPFALERGARPPAAIILLIVTMLYLLGTLTVRSDEWVLFLLRPVIYLGAGMLLAMMRWPRRMDRAALVGMVILVAGFAISATAAGVSLVDGVINNLVTLDRRGFVRNTIKATFNAFAQGDEDFTASQINMLSAFLMIGFSIMAAYRRPMLAAALAVGVIILFSTSSIVSLLFLLALLVTRSIKSAQGWLALLVGIGLAGAAATVFYEPIASYIEANVESDTTSRAGRLTQYSGALDQIEESPIWGSGQTRTEDGIIHNLVLFAWASSGIVPMLMLLAFYGMIGVTMLYAIYMFYRVEVGWIAVIGLLTVFLFRSLVGGGGGLPSIVSACSLGLAFLEARRLSQGAAGMRAPGYRPPATGPRLAAPHRLQTRS